jgi:hypothetical protein
MYECVTLISDKLRSSLGLCVGPSVAIRAIEIRDGGIRFLRARLPEHGQYDADQHAQDGR